MRTSTAALAINLIEGSILPKLLAEPVGAHRVQGGTSCRARPFRGEPFAQFFMILSRAFFSRM